MKIPGVHTGHESSTPRIGVNKVVGSAAAARVPPLGGSARRPVRALNGRGESQLPNMAETGTATAADENLGLEKIN